jgi:Flp pilus assembly protein TadG
MMKILSNPAEPAGVMCDPRVRGGRHGERGSAVIELAIFLVFLGPLLIFGTAELASLAYASIEISNAAHAGAMYGMQSSTYAANTSVIQTAAQAEAADFGSSLTVTPTIYYACALAQGGTQYSTQAAATSACAGSGNHVLEFLQVKTSATVTPPFHVPPLLASYAVSGISVMEVQQ